MRTVLKREENDELKEKKGQLQNRLYAAIVFIILAMLVSLYFAVKGTPAEAYVMEWMNIVVRVMHITFGIAWIGASFYFVFLENALNRTDNVRDELAGNLWAVHGGGFYYLEKYKVAPKTLPKQLHWFKYEAYFTWLSGFTLLFIIYYFNASALLIDPRVMKLTTMQAVGISIGSFIAGWRLYDLLCKSPLKKKPWLFFVTGIMLMTGFAWFYSQVFSGRAAFIHFGAMLGTLMAANVFFVIIPSQKAMVNAAKRGEMPDATRGKKALFRSIHNNYFTLPVLFVMVSNHFPSTFSHAYNWIVLAAISIGTAGIKHWLNLREQGKLSVWVLPASVILLLAVAYATTPSMKMKECKEEYYHPAALHKLPLIDAHRRCVPCSAKRSKV